MPELNAPRPFAGCIAVLEQMIADGLLDDESSFETVATIEARNAGTPVMIIFANGSFVIQGEADALIMAACEPEYVCHIPVPAITAAINQAYN